jgi:hypothetical protein
MTILRSSSHGSRSVPLNRVFIELEPNLSSCIETLAKREYKKALNTILNTGTEDKELSEKLETLTLFLESTDFGALRSRYERHLEEGKKVKFRIYSTKGKVSYELTVGQHSRS